MKEQDIRNIENRLLKKILNIYKMRSTIYINTLGPSCESFCFEKVINVTWCHYSHYIVNIYIPHGLSETQQRSLDIVKCALHERNYEALFYNIISLTCEI